ncbi:GIY-YIG nuclease family protein [Patescibacteria group bacterium]|nr:MAG: GIY-YIG nuclease family protein [Patescibacteria group bacterium]
MWHVYILQSLKSGRYYIGLTCNVQTRLHQHNAGATKSTKPYRPWILIHVESFPAKCEARKRELQLKRMKGGMGFKQLIKK